MKLLRYANSQTDIVIHVYIDFFSWSQDWMKVNSTKYLEKFSKLAVESQLEDFNVFVDFKLSLAMNLLPHEHIFFLLQYPDCNLF
jgi:hypothetical protein